MIEHLYLEEYIALDEGVMTTYFQMWMKETDPILADLSNRLLIESCFNTLNLIRQMNMKKCMSWNNYLKKRELDPEYYLVVDSSSDLPYDFYRPGEENERLPIFLKMPNGELSELSRSSDIVDAISGKRRTDHKLYFPEDLLEDGKEENPLYSQILEMLKG